MGRYINPPENWPEGAKGKKRYIESLGGMGVSLEEARQMVDTHGIIVWVDNGPFEALAYAYDARELDYFLQPGDPRPKKLYAVDKAVAEQHAKD